MLLKQGEVKKYLEKIMNTRMLKFFQGHVIACSHVLTSYSQVFIFQKIHKDLWGG